MLSVDVKEYLKKKDFLYCREPVVYKSGRTSASVSMCVSVCVCARTCMCVCSRKAAGNRGFVRVMCALLVFCIICHRIFIFITYNILYNFIV